MKRDYGRPRLMRKLETEDFKAAPGNVPKFPIKYDGLVYGHHGEFDAEWQGLPAATAKFDYFNIFTKPEQAWVGQGNGYFDRAWALPSVKAGGVEVRYQYSQFNNPLLIAWHDMTPAQVTDFGTFMLGLLRLSTTSAPIPVRFFLDLWFSSMRDWMLLGVTLDQIDGDLALWGPRVTQLLEVLARANPMTNGDRTSPADQYLERSGNPDWRGDLDAWESSDGRHVMEIRTSWPWEVNLDAVRSWSFHGGWLAVDGDRSDELYGRLDGIRQSRHSSV